MYCLEQYYEDHLYREGKVYNISQRKSRIINSATRLYSVAPVGFPIWYIVVEGL